MRSIAAIRQPILVDHQAHTLIADWVKQLRASADRFPQSLTPSLPDVTNIKTRKKNLSGTVERLALSLENLNSRLQNLPYVLANLPASQAKIWTTIEPLDLRPRSPFDPILDRAFAAHKRLSSFKDVISTDTFNNFLDSPLLLLLAKPLGITFLDQHKVRITTDDIPSIDTSALVNMCNLHSPKSVYLPVLRTAHSIFTNEQTRIESSAYEQTVRLLYRIDKEIDIFTGLNLYEQFLVERSGKRTLRDRFAAFEGFLGRHFFKSQPIDIVPEYTRNLAEQHIRVKIGNSLDHQLHQLGDGINALILLVYRIFMADPGTWFFIEEPETHLHPGLQRIFIETIISDPQIRERNMRFFLTSHSNHMLELAMTHPEEVAVFSLTPAEENDKFRVSSSQGPDLRVLDELGVRNASVLLANCSLWVEGPSDRLYISAYLLAYAKSHRGEPDLREDIEYAFFEYAGSNLQHYLFSQEEDSSGDTRKIQAQFIANRVFLLADQDIGKTRKHENLKRVAAPPRFVYRTTSPGIEVENLLSASILRIVLPRLFKDPKVHERLNVATLMFEEDMLPNTRLGSYLDKVLRPQLQDKTPKLFSAASAQNPSAILQREENAETEPSDVSAAAGRTLADRWKDKLAREVYNLASEGGLEWHMLSTAAQNLTKEIVSFVLRNST